jgi:hypothetical protein
MTVLDPKFWAVLGTLTVLGALATVGLTLALERLMERLTARPPRPVPARTTVGVRATARHHGHRPTHAH